MHPSRLICWLAILLLLASRSLLPAAVWHVSPGESIQAAMDSAAVGDTVIVAQGTYKEVIDFGGKDIILQSEDPTSETVRMKTILRNPTDWSLDTGVVNFSGTETEACHLKGLSILYGWKTAYHVAPGGGIEGNGTHATIQFCIIRGNGALLGGGIGECHGLIEDCVITENSASLGCNPIPADPGCVWVGREGGGLYDCDGIIRRCKVTKNIAETTLEFDSSYGGGFSRCDGVIEDCEITENHAKGYWEDPVGHGGAMYRCNGEILDNHFSGNRQDTAGVLHNCFARIAGNEFRDHDSIVIIQAFASTVIEDNLFIDNNACIYGNSGVVRNNLFIDTTSCVLANIRGSVYNNIVVTNAISMDGCSAMVRNCIFYNPAGSPIVFENDTSTFESCLITGWTGGGTGNRDGNPRFVDPANGDYRLRADSPLIDAGRVIDGLITDLDGNPRPVKSVDWQARGDGSGFDIGAYEYQSVVSQPPPPPGIGWAVE